MIKSLEKVLQDPNLNIQALKALYAGKDGIAYDFVHGAVLIDSGLLGKVTMHLKKQGIAYEIIDKYRHPELYGPIAAPR